jgi:hypothetical protein
VEKVEWAMQRLHQQARMISMKQLRAKCSINQDSTTWRNEKDRGRESCYVAAMAWKILAVIRSLRELRYLIDNSISITPPEASRPSNSTSRYRKDSQRYRDSRSVKKERGQRVFPFSHATMCH